MQCRPLPATLCGRPFTTAEAYAAGVGFGVLSGPAVRRVFSGVYVVAEVELTERMRVAAALKVLPVGTVVTGVTALRLRGVEVGEPTRLEFASSHPHQVRLPGIHVARLRVLPPSSARLVQAEHAFVAAAVRLNLLELVTAGDWLVRLKHVRPASLIACAKDSTVARVGLARRGAALVRQRVDSPRETRLRLCLVLAGLPEPACNVVLGTTDEPIGRVDLVYLEFKLILEYEGDQHRTDLRQWNTDIARQEAFADEGWSIIRITAARIRRPREVVDRVLQALRAAGYDGPDPTFGAEWVALFASKAR